MGTTTVCLYSIVAHPGFFCKVKMTREKKRYTGSIIARSLRSKRAIEPERALEGAGGRRMQYPSGRVDSRRSAMACDFRFIFAVSVRFHASARFQLLRPKGKSSARRPRLSFAPLVALSRMA